jgi:hypothetical protein
MAGTCTAGPVGELPGERVEATRVPKYLAGKDESPKSLAFHFLAAVVWRTVLQDFIRDLPKMKAKSVVAVADWKMDM